MSDINLPNPNDPDQDSPDPDLLALLSAPDVWDAADPGDEVSIMQAIQRSRDEESTVTDIAAPRTPSRLRSVISSQRVGSFVAGVAAALIVVAGFLALSDNDQSRDRQGLEVALTATELAPEANGSVEIIETPNGTMIFLTISDLPPAPEGTYYEAWLISESGGVSAGTFHLRGGGGEIELWSGVTPAEYPVFSVTIQTEAEQMSSGNVVLRGAIGN